MPSDSARRLDVCGHKECIAFDRCLYGDHAEPSSSTRTLQCRCSFPRGCSQRATQEDMLCDVCRRGPELHMHFGTSGDPDSDAPMEPIATTGPAVFK